MTCQLRAVTFQVTLEAFAKVDDLHDAVDQDTGSFEDRGLGGGFTLADARLEGIGTVESWAEVEVSKAGPLEWVFSGGVTVFIQPEPPNLEGHAEWSALARLSFQVEDSVQYEFLHVDWGEGLVFSPELTADSGVLGPGDYYVFGLLGGDSFGLSETHERIFFDRLRLVSGSIPDSGSSGLLLLSSIGGLLGLRAISQR